MNKVYRGEVWEYLKYRSICTHEVGCLTPDDNASAIWQQSSDIGNFMKAATFRYT